MAFQQNTRGSTQVSVNPAENEKAARQLGQPFLSRENSSNGDQNRQNFLAKSYEPKKGGVKKYLGNKHLHFQ
jgi:hypothetical protein